MIFSTLGQSYKLNNTMYWRPLQGLQMQHHALSVGALNLKIIGIKSTILMLTFSPGRIPWKLLLFFSSKQELLCIRAGACLDM